MVTLALVVILVTAAATIALVVNRRGPDVPTSPSFGVPQQLDRDDFATPEVEWLFALFSSQTCLACIDARLVLQAVDSSSAQVHEIEVESNRALHDKYSIDAVPTIVLADHEGVVQWSYLGAPDAETIADLLVDIGAAPPNPDETAVDIG